MSDVIKTPKPNQSTDLVLQEVWRIKDALSASYGHDLDRLFAETRARQKHSGHPIVTLKKRKPQRTKT